MAITRVQTVSGSSANVASPSSVAATWGSTTTAGNLLIAAVYTAAVVSGFTTPSNWVLIGSAVTNTGVLRLYYIANAAARSGAETFSWTALASAAASLTLIEYSGIAAAPLDQNNSSTGTSAAPATGSVTTLQASELVLGFVGQVTTSATAISFSAPTGGFTLVGQQVTTNTHSAPSTQVDLGLLEDIVSSTGTYSSGCTSNTNSTWSGIIASFIGAAPSGLPRRHLPRLAAKEPRGAYCW